MAEVLEQAGNLARANNNKCTIPCNIWVVIRDDDELSKLLSIVTITANGALPNVHLLLLPKKCKRAAEYTCG